MKVSACTCEIASLRVYYLSQNLRSKLGVGTTIGTSIRLCTRISCVLRGDLQQNTDKGFHKCGCFSMRADSQRWNGPESKQ